MNINNTPHQPDPSYRFDNDPMWDLIGAQDQRLGINTGSLWSHPDITPRIRCRLLEAADSYCDQMPSGAEPIDFDKPVAHLVTADAIWAHGSQFVIDEIDQEDLCGDEPHFVRRIVELWAWASRRPGFRGIRVVNVRRPHHTWFIAGVEPAESPAVFPTLVSGTMPKWMRP